MKRNPGNQDTVHLHTWLFSIFS